MFQRPTRWRPGWSRNAEWITGRAAAKRRLWRDCVPVSTARGPEGQAAGPGRSGRIQSRCCAAREGLQTRANGELVQWRNTRT